MQRLVILTLVWAAVWAGTAHAQVEITGRVAHPKTLSAEALAAEPPVMVEMTYDTEKGPLHAAFKGAALWPLLQQAEVIDEPRRDRLQHTLLVRGKDGYAVALAIGEVNPNLEGKPVIIATEQDGKPLDAPRLVVPGDRHQARAVRELVGIEVR